MLSNRNDGSEMERSYDCFFFSFLLFTFLQLILFTDNFIFILDKILHFQAEVHSGGCSHSNLYVTCFYFVGV